jgi:hypothetical protein
MMMKIYVFWDITPCSPLKVSRRSEEYVASIFRVEELAKQETSVKRVASRASVHNHCCENSNPAR